MIGLDMRFHGIFYAHSGNPILVAVWPLLEGTIRKFVAVAGPQYTRDYNELALRHDRLLANVPDRRHGGGRARTRRARPGHLAPPAA